MTYNNQKFIYIQTFKQVQSSSIHQSASHLQFISQQQLIPLITTKAKLIYIKLFIIYTKLLRQTLIVYACNKKSAVEGAFLPQLARSYFRYSLSLSGSFNFSTSAGSDTHCSMASRQLLDSVPTATKKTWCATNMLYFENKMTSQIAVGSHL